MTSNDTGPGPGAGPVGARPVLPSGVEAGFLGGLAVVLAFLARDLLVGLPLETPSRLGTLLLHGVPAASRTPHSPGASAVYNAAHFAAWVAIGCGGAALMRRVEASAREWYLPWIAVGLLFAGGFAVDAWAQAVGLARLHLWLGAVVGVAAAAWFLGVRYPRAMARVRGFGREIPPGGL